VTVISASCDDRPHDFRFGPVESLFVEKGLGERVFHGREEDAEVSKGCAIPQDWAGADQDAIPSSFRQDY
jgi:hypothetical protein